MQKIYPREGDEKMVYLGAVVQSPYVSVGDYTTYYDWTHDPRDFERNNILYHYPINRDRVTIGKFCSLACGVRFLMNGGNHNMDSLSTYTFPVCYAEWGLTTAEITTAWQNRGDIAVGNDVWLGYESVIMAGVTIGDGAIIGTRAVVTRDVPPYTIVGGVPAKPIRKRFDDATIERLLALRWWDWPVERIKAALPFLRGGDLDELEQLAK